MQVHFQDSEYINKAKIYALLDILDAENLDGFNVEIDHDLETIFLTPGKKDD